MALVVRFGRFELDEDAGELRADGRVLELQAKPWALLVLLCGHPGRLFTRDELLERLWPDVTVEDGSLSRTVSRLRRVLGSEVLQTVPRRGYRLAAAVEAVPAEVTERRGVAEAIDRGLDAFGAVLVAGPPGSGRTAASRAPSRGGARRWLAVDADRGLVGSMAAALGVGVADPNSVSLALAALGPTLIVVDDLDHDPRGVELVDQWRAAAPLARWLVTAGSRLPLDRCAVVWLDPLPEGEAIALLAERSGLPLDRADPAASALARALDGNPLALTLAARLLRLMPPGELVNRLGEQRLALLKDPRTSLAAALASAWDRLPTELRTAAARLACVRAALPIGAAEAAVGDDAAERLLRLVEAGWATRSGSTLAVPNNARAWIEA
ncbi:MAG: winged helix-turn-helix domain-containing protein, partial [Myxococcota bacterium]